MSPHIAYFVSPHGFGHAARTCAVIDAIRRIAPEARIELFTTTPDWFFSSSLNEPVGYHSVATDLGLVQASALREDLGQSVRQLQDDVPFASGRIEPLIDAVQGCDLIICDIAPIGLEVARRCSLPSVLIENFTWDWIYRGYVEQEPDFAPIADAFESAFALAGLHIQAEPICRVSRDALRVPPISRRPRHDRPSIRKQLGISESSKVTMVTMGGVEWDYADIDQHLAALQDDRWLIIPGSTSEPRRLGRAILLPHRSDFYHPDLIRASDAVIGKLGYSTIAEVHRCGIPFGFVPRPSFPESPPLEQWVQQHLPSSRIDAADFESWRWLETVDILLDLPQGSPADVEGADIAARHILDYLASA